MALRTNLEWNGIFRNQDPGFFVFSLFYTSKIKVFKWFFVRGVWFYEEPFTSVEPYQRYKVLCSGTMFFNDKKMGKYLLKCSLRNQKMVLLWLPCENSFLVLLTPSFVHLFLIWYPGLILVSGYCLWSFRFLLGFLFSSKIMLLVLHSGCFPISRLVFLGSASDPPLPWPR